MKPIPIGQILTEFGAKPPPRSATDPHIATLQERSGNPKKGPPVDKIPSIIEDTHARGVAEGRAAATAELTAKLEEQKQFYEKQRELERYTWASREATQFAAQLAEGVEAVEAAIAESTARILKPFLTEQIHRQAIADLWEALEVILKQEQGLTIEVSGPEDILQLLHEKLSSRNATAVFTPGERVEVRVRVGQTILETQLGAWLSKLEEIME